MARILTPSLGSKDSYTHAERRRSGTVKRMLSYLYTDDHEQEDASEARDNKTEERDKRAEQDASSDSASDSIGPPASIGFNNIKVYVTAEKFGIEPLRKMARKRFANWYKLYRGDQFAEATRQALEMPPPHDRDLRKTVLNAIRGFVDDEYQWLASNDALLDVLGQCDALKDVSKAVISLCGVGVMGYIKQMEALQLRVCCSIC